MNDDPADDSEDYAGIPGMSAGTDDEAAADRCPVPESDSDSEDDDEIMPQVDGTAQAAGAEAPQVAWDDASPGGVVRPRDEADSDVASVREPEHSPKKARLSAFDDSVRTSAGRGKAELQSLFKTSTVRRILDDLSKQNEFQMPKNRAHRDLLLADEWRTEC